MKQRAGDMAGLNVSAKEDDTKARSTTPCLFYWSTLSRRAMGCCSAWMNAAQGFDRYSEAMLLKEIRQKLNILGDKNRARILQGFFKTGAGEYGEGDTFLGIPVPTLRKLAREYNDLPLAVTRQMLKSPSHEERLLGLLILVRNYQNVDESGQERIYRLYLNNTRYINNWDLVDVSAQHIVGAFLMTRKKTPLYRLARSQSLWERRIAILATFHALKQGRMTDTLRIATMLLSDEEDLIHKAVGWMLREVGKRDLRTAEQYLQKYYPKMPRTMLRYAIERFPKAKQQRYLRGKI